MRPTFFRRTLFVVVLACGLPSVGATLWGAAQTLAWPAVTNETKPWTRWWWLGSISTEPDLRFTMEQYAAAGLGGLEITPIYGVRGYEDQFITYLTPEWMQRLEFVLREARRLDLGIDMATGNGWPFGGPWIGKEQAARFFTHRTYTVQPGERLTEPVRGIEEPVLRFAGPTRVAIDQLREPIAANSNLQELALDQVRFAEPLPLHTLMAFPVGSPGREPIDLTSRVGPDGTLDWQAPADGGAWALYAIFLGWHGKQVERAGPGGEGYAIDHFDADALHHYLARFDAAYTGHDLSGLRAYFNDSYEVDDAQGEANFTPDFFAEFQRRRGYDLRPHLPDLIAGLQAPAAPVIRRGPPGGPATENNTPRRPPAPLPEKQARVLTDYRETISDLLLDEFTRPWAAWAEKHGALVRNQAHGSPANILDLYAASGIPEQEGGDPLRLNFASSAAHVTGKRLASSETATWLTEHFVTTLADIKRRVDTTLLGGINHICYHGTAYSPPDDPWPGFHFYASVEANPSNPWWDHFSALNTYVTRAQSFLQSGEPAESLLLYSPIHDAWSAGGGRNPHFAGPVGRGAEAAAALWEAGYTFDYVTDRMLAETRFVDGALTTSGGTRYEAVVVPAVRQMPLATVEKLFALAERGATIVFHDSMPADVPGLAQLAQRRTELQVFTEAFRRSSEPAPEEIRLLTWNKGRLVEGANLVATLDWLNLPREPWPSLGLQFVRRRHAHGTTYFIVNPGEKPFADRVPLPGGATHAARFDAMTGRFGVLAVEGRTDLASTIRLQLAPGESCLLLTSKEAFFGPAFLDHVPSTTAAIALNGTWNVEFISGGPTLPAAMRIDELVSWTEFGGEAGKAFSGKARYTTRFARPAASAPAANHGWLLDLGRVAESARVRMNGCDLGIVFTAPFRVHLPADLLADENTLEVEVANLMANRIADLDRRGVPWKKFYNTNMPSRLPENRGPDGQFTAAAWSPRESGLLGPVTIAPVQAPE